MVFASHVFLFYFLPAVLLVYYLLPRGRNAFLTIASYVFYGWWEPWFVSLMLFSTILDFVCGGIIGAPGASTRNRKIALGAAIAGDLGLLAFFKYYTFTAENVNRLAAMVGAPALPVLSVVLPIGISFYTFESLSYTIDVYRGHARAARKFSDISCFVSLFPHLVAGPIVRYNILAEQIQRRTHTLDKFAAGIAMFILGFAKKILIANPMGRVADAVFGASDPGTVAAWFGIAAYSFQIYFDFSGYSDMAIGLGRMFGFMIPENFRSPYLSESITDFWRRWHISLSTWLRDYLYIPLGGNRGSALRTYRNLAIVMVLGGLWHGANWTFAVWGAIHGSVLAFERWLGKKAPYDVLPRPVAIGATYGIVLITWVFFRAESLPRALSYLSSMFSASASSPLLALEIYTPFHLSIFAVGAIIAFQRVEVADFAGHLTAPRMALLLPLFAITSAVMFTQTFNPFLYFQF